MQERKKSKEIYDSSCAVMPGGVNSPVRSFRSLAMTPFVGDRGAGDQLYDVDGNVYIDYCMSWGSLILGHAHPSVVKGLSRQLIKGSSFGVTTELEKDFATKIVLHLPSIEKIRFVSSGTEATMSALRLARGYTGKNLIVKFNGNYHGHVDSLLIQAGSDVSYLPQATSQGIPQDVIKHTVSLPYNDIEEVASFLRSREDVAAVLIEPIASNMGLIPAKPAFLKMLREETEKKGALLIFDEVVSGFRLGLQGAQGFYDIEPDLTCLGKIIGGGFPVAAFGGKKEIMEMLSPLGGVYQAGTLSGNPISIQAGLLVLEHLENQGFYEQLEAKAKILLDPIEEMIKTHTLPVCLNRIGSMFSFFFGVSKVHCQEDLKNLNLEIFKEFFQTLFHQGIYFSPSAYETCFVSAAHQREHLEKTRDCIMKFLSLIYHVNL